MTSKTIKITAICGSLRKASCNLGLLRSAQKVLPAGASLNILDISNLPLFNEDLESNLPEPVRSLRSEILKADALLFAVPEYNGSVSAPLKNAFDWASRNYPNDKSPLTGKPVAMVSSGGRLGGARGQEVLTRSIDMFQMKLVTSHSVAIPRWGANGDQTDANGNFPDELVLPKLTPLLAELVKIASQ